MTRADLHRLVDELPDESVDAAVVLLTRAKDPVLAALQAAPFDEPETEEERRAVAEARAERERGIEPVPLESVLAEFDGNQ
ncbi:MAG TPA: hypothetical protein VFV03_09375 [Solirubrobacteraceae bacterium]|nr:hypothetical protein [Solirubrobacteraceae bacterium]